MEDVVAILVVAAVLVGVIIVVARGPRHRRNGGAVMIDVLNEIYHPAAHLSKQEIQAQEELGFNTETPDDFDPPWREPESHPAHRRYRRG